MEEPPERRLLEQCEKVVFSQNLNLLPLDYQLLQIRIQWKDNFSALLVLNSRCSDGSSLGFRGGSL